LPVFDPHRTVDREAAVAPGQKVADGLLADETLVHERPQDLGAEEAFEVAGVETRQMVEASIGAEAAIGDENMDVRVEVEQLARGLEEAHGTGRHLSAIEGHIEVQPQGSPGTGSEFTEELSVVAEEDPQPLGDGEHHLAVVDVLEQLFLRPGRPQQVSLLMTAWAQGPQLAGEGHQKLVPAVGAADSRHTVVEDAAVEEAPDRGLHTAA
jgi:hypothetical protein